MKALCDILLHTEGILMYTNDLLKLDIGTQTNGQHLTFT